jgi:hypothetical protein
VQEWRNCAKHRDRLLEFTYSTRSLLLLLPGDVLARIPVEMTYVLAETDDSLAVRHMTGQQPTAQVSAGRCCWCAAMPLQLDARLVALQQQQQQQRQRRLHSYVERHVQCFALVLLAADVTSVHGAV